MPLSPSRRFAHLPLALPGLLALCAVATTAAGQLADSTGSTTSSSQAPIKHASGMDEYGLVPGRFVIDLGGYLPNVSTHATLSTQLHNGTNINFENRLGLTPNTQTLDVLASWRISKRNYLAFQYFSFGRSGTKTLADSIVWGDHTYQAGVTLDAHNTVTYYGISYRFYIWRERNWEFGPGLGIDALHLTSELGVRVAASGGGGSVMDTAQKTGSITAPVPMIGIYGDWEFVPRLLLKGGFQYIYINDIAGIGGHVSDDALGVEWYPLSHFGVGGVYHFVGANIYNLTTGRGNKVDFNYVIQGPSLYVVATF